MISTTTATLTALAFGAVASTSESTRAVAGSNLNVTINDITCIDQLALTSLLIVYRV